MVNVLMIIIIVVVGIFVLLGGILLYFWKKSGKKFPFILYSPNGERADIIYARVRIDPENPANKQFVFDTLDSPLTIKRPTIFLNGIPHREITFNKLSEYNYLKNQGIKVDEKKKEELENQERDVYQYVDGTKIDNKAYLEKCLEPEEKQIAISRLKENTRRYQDPMNKYAAYTLIGTFVMSFLICVCMGYCFFKVGDITDDVVTIAKEQDESIKVLNHVATTNQQTTEQLTGIAAALTQNKEITRQIT
ncbi:MAG: hypothetical protein KAU20_07820 [Nanoarchaeota archaeon]|nr:hypothetical protein [Nanoarchaeota archaeon]